MPKQRIINIAPDSTIKTDALIDYETKKLAFFSSGDTVSCKITPFTDGQINSDINGGTLNIEFRESSDPKSTVYKDASAVSIMAPSLADFKEGKASTATINISSDDSSNIPPGTIFCTIFYSDSSSNRLTFFDGSICVTPGISSGSGPKPPPSGRTIQFKDEKDKANGYAGLNSAAQIENSLLPEGIAANTEYLGSVAGVSLPDTAQKAGDWYYISTDGMSQSISWKLGDRAVYEGTSGHWLRLPAPSAPPVSSQDVLDTETVTTLKALDVTSFKDGQLIYLKAHTAQNADKYSGGGMFILNKSGDIGASKDDNGTIIAAHGGTNWYWIRLVDNYVTPEMFGAVSDWNGDISMPTGTDSSNAFTSTFAFSATKKNVRVSLSAGGSYRLNTAISLKSGIILDGNKATIGFTPNSAANAINLANDSSIKQAATVKNLDLKCNSMATGGINVDSQNAVIDSCFIECSADASSAISSGGTKQLVVKHCELTADIGIDSQAESLRVTDTAFNNCVTHCVLSKGVSIANIQSCIFSGTAATTATNPACIMASDSNIIADGCLFSGNQCPTISVNNSKETDLGIVLNDFYFISEGTASARSNIIENAGCKFIVIGNGTSTKSFFTNIVNNSSSNLMTIVDCESEISKNITKRFNNVADNLLIDNGVNGTQKLSAPEIQITGNGKKFTQKYIIDGSEDYLSFQNNSNTEYLAIAEDGKVFLGQPHLNATTGQVVMAANSQIMARSGHTGNIFEGIVGTNPVFNVDASGTFYTNALDGKAGYSALGSKDIPVHTFSGVYESLKANTPVTIDIDASITTGIISWSIIGSDGGTLVGQNYTSAWMGLNTQSISYEAALSAGSSLTTMASIGNDSSTHKIQITPTKVVSGAKLYVWGNYINFS